MSFSPEWLALREPIDHASVNAQVRNALKSRLAGRDNIRVVDLGCGTGSNLRGTFDALGPHQAWTLVDYDPKLMVAAHDRLIDFADMSQEVGAGLHIVKGSHVIDVAFRRADLAGGDFDAVIDGADLVTAAALFDLVSQPVIEQLAAAVTRRRQTFYTVLTYDGIATWLPGHGADTQMRDAFNRHQRTDKGFGAAAGPGATDALTAAFQARGYEVYRGHSPWIVDRRYPRLRAELDSGFAAAVSETGMVEEATTAAWLAARRSAGNDAVAVVGHEDLLAVPV